MPISAGEEYVDSASVIKAIQRRKTAGFAKLTINPCANDLNLPLVACIGFPEISLIGFLIKEIPNEIRMAAAMNLTIGNSTY